MGSIATSFAAILAILGSFLPPAPAQDPKTQVVTGTMWVVEKDRKRLPIGGSFHVCYEGPMESDWVDVPLSSGAFRCELPGAATDLVIGQIRIEDRDAVCTWTGSLANASKPLDLEARFVPTSRVRVRMRDTQVELNECTRTDAHAGPGYVIQSLPYVVPVWDETCPVFGWGQNRSIQVRAPGCAWASVNVDMLAGGDFWVDLVAEARLVVSVVMPPGVPSQSLSIWGAAGSHSGGTLEHDGQELTFDGLVPGRYSLDTANNTPGSHPMLRRAVIDLAPGETRRVTIDLTPDPAKKRAKVSGTLSVDPSWGKEFNAPRVRIVPLISEERGYGDGEYVDARLNGAGTFSFDAGLLEVGKQFVAVEPFGWGVEIEVGEATKEIMLCVAPKVHCKLRIIDAQTREDVEEDSIAWHGAAAGYRSRMEFKNVERNKESKLFEFDAPRGPIRFAISPEGYGWYNKLDQLQDNPTELTIALEPCCRIRVRLRDGERTVLFPQLSIPSATRVGGGAEDESRMGSGDSITLSVAEPGSYSVSVPTIPGYQRPDPIVVEARRREVVDIVFQLRR